MNVVDRQMLTGFRRPTAWEKEVIEQELRRRNRRYLRVMSFLKSVFSVAAGGILLGCLSGSGDRTLVMTSSDFLLFGLMVWVIFRIRMGRKKIRWFLDEISRGEFQVLDCRAYEESFDVDSAGKAVVKIHNEAGQYCRDWFPLKRELVSVCRQNPETRLLLMKGSLDTYELFGDVMRNSRKDK